MKRNLLILLTALLLSCSLTGCGGSEVISVNVDNNENIYGSSFGEYSLIKIGNGLYYDSTTRIVYWWNGMLDNMVYASTTPSPYYAPNGLPYKYNPETNTFEEIDLSEEE
jgi:hypothetical protein